MNDQNHFHAWDLKPAQAVSLQKDLAQHIRIESFLPYLPKENNGKIKKIAGVDVSMNRFGKVAYACIVILSFPDLNVLDIINEKDILTFPYIPGLLSFREIPVLLKAWEKIKADPKLMPDILIVDGQGIAHPRKLGIASHFGLLIDKPTIGCAKSILTGKIHTEDELSMKKGSRIFLYDRFKEPTSETIIGTILRSKDKVKPLIISPGHKITLEESIDLILQTLKNHRLPEPTRMAHIYGNEYRKISREKLH